MNEVSKIFDYIQHFARSKGQSIKSFEQMCGLSNGAVKGLTVNSRRQTWDRIVKAFPDFDVHDMMKECCNVDYMDVNRQNDNGTLEYVSISKIEYEGMKNLIETMRRKLNSQNNDDAVTDYDVRVHISKEEYEDMKHRLSSQQKTIDYLLSQLTKQTEPNCKETNIE